MTFVGEHHEPRPHHRAFERYKSGWKPKKLIGAVIMLGLIGAFVLLREHWAHIAGYWPYLLLLACPLMHLFHGHGGHGSHGGESGRN